MTETRAVATSAAILGSILATLRENMGVKQNEMAYFVNIAPSSWSRIEKGEAAISVDQLRVAAKCLGKSVGDILSIADDAELEAANNGVTIRYTRTRVRRTYLNFEAINDQLVIAKIGEPVPSLPSVRASETLAQPMLMSKINETLKSVAGK